MQYHNISLGRFLSRPNRFVAKVELDGRTEICHVKNTSRLGELLVPGVAASVQKAQNPARKTGYDLIAVEHEGRWVNIDSQAPNKLFGPWATESGFFGAPSLLRAEVTHGNSRFDFYLEAEGRKTFVEVKGVTLVEEGIARFPGAPTLRGVKHLEELCRCVDEGFGACMAFIVKRNDVRGCGPNDALDPAFGAALRRAVAHGVQAIALCCNVTPSSLEVRHFVDIVL